MERRKLVNGCIGRGRGKLLDVNIGRGKNPNHECSPPAQYSALRGRGRIVYKLSQDTKTKSSSLENQLKNLTVNARHADSPKRISNGSSINSLKNEKVLSWRVRENEAKDNSISKETTSNWCTKRNEGNDSGFSSKTDLNWRNRNRGNQANIAKINAFNCNGNRISRGRGVLSICDSRYLVERKGTENDKGTCLKEHSLDTQSTEDSKWLFLKQYQCFGTQRFKKYCQRNHIMFIMRGLPGSGKSTLTNYIASQLHENDFVICSADHFRYDENGVYNWSSESLGSTHQLCQKKVEENCRSGTNVIFVDNTNIKKADMQVYLNMANKHGYLLIIIATKDRNVKNLSKRNVHEVPETKIQNMKDKFKDLIPYYIGWGIGKQNKMLLKCEIEKCFTSTQYFHPFQQFCKKLKVNDLSVLFNVYHMKNASSNKTIAHVTAGYLKGGEIPKSDKYVHSKSVSDALGTVQEISVIGWCFTPDSLFARVRLGNDQRNLWGRHDSFDNEKLKLVLESIFDFSKKAESKSKQKSKKKSKHKSYESMFTKLDIDKNDDNGFKISYFSENFPSSFLKPNFSIGSTAHITLGVTNENKPVAAKDDLVYILLHELNRLPDVEFCFPDHMIRCYGDDYWVIYLKEPLIVETLFSGAYN